MKECYYATVGAPTGGCSGPILYVRRYGNVIYRDEPYKDYCCERHVAWLVEIMLTNPGAAPIGWERIKPDE